MKQHITKYLDKLHSVTNAQDWSSLEDLAQDLLELIKSSGHLFICGNGGSAGNAIHLANDFLYGIAPQGPSIKVEALSANSAVLTCLGNDIGYNNIFSHQIKVKAKAGDMLIVLSGSGNSGNIITAIEQAKSMNVKTCAILGFDGGKAKDIADLSLHFQVDDMQIAEDMQLIVGHMLMQYLNEKIKALYV